MPRKIERDEALDHALTLFWDHGYRGTSMEMLTAKLGVEKPSIYASFGSKQALYLAALRRYREALAERLRGELAAAATSRAGIEGIVGELMARGERRSRRGCFAANCALERADHDAEARAEVRAIFSEFVAVLAEALAAAQAAGEVRGDVPADTLARLLVNAIEGARVLEKAGQSAAAMDALAPLLLQLLDAPVARRAARRGMAPSASRRASAGS